MQALQNYYLCTLNKIQLAEFLPALAMRLILAPVFIVAGYSKLNLGNPDLSFFASLLANPDIVTWFGNSDWGLGLPMPGLMAFLAGWSEFIGGWLLLFGLFTRVITIPLGVTMLVAIFVVHWDSGWFAIAPSSPDTSAALALSWLNIPGAQESLANSVEVAERLGRIKGIVEQHGYPEYLYDKGPVVILNNGIEFATIYLVMLLSLFMTGAGKWLSLDHWLKVYFCKKA